MVSTQIEIHKLNVITDDPRFEGFALNPAPSILGRDSLDDDLTPGFADAEDNIDWQQPRLAANWVPPQAIGRVAEFNDYPGVDTTLPAFSSRAVDILRDLLEPNGEIRPLRTETDTEYFFYNILTISDALDRSESKCDFWCEPPTTATTIDYFAFDSTKLVEMTIFRIRELPMSVLVTNEFVSRVEFFGLNGFSFTKIWPLPPNVNWREKTTSDARRMRDQLKRQTLVLILKRTCEAGESTKIADFEDSLDRKLRPVSLSTDYRGSYEGHDNNVGKYRMFFSCPDADKLLDYLKLEIKGLEWPSGVTVCRRYGRMCESDAREKTTVI